MVAISEYCSGARSPRYQKRLSRAGCCAAGRIAEKPIPRKSSCAVVTTRHMAPESE